MIAVIGTLAWEFQVSLPLMARDTFHRGAGAYGLMASVMGAGAVVGGLLTASRRESPGPGPGAGGHRVGRRHPGRGRGSDPADRAGRPALRWLREHHVQRHGQNHASAGCRSCHAGSRHGPLGPGLVGFDPHRRPHHRLDRPGPGGPVVAGRRRPLNRAHRPGRLAGAQADRRASGVQFIPRIEGRSAGWPRPTALPVGRVFPPYRPSGRGCGRPHQISRGVASVLFLTKSM